jgi:hypothetical protein
MTLHYLKFEEKNPWRTRSKKKKAGFCQRQIDRYDRWAEQDPCPEFLAAWARWTLLLKSVMDGRI